MAHKRDLTDPRKQARVAKRSLILIFRVQANWILATILIIVTNTNEIAIAKSSIDLQDP